MPLPSCLAWKGSSVSTGSNHKSPIEHPYPQRVHEVRIGTFARPKFCSSEHPAACSRLAVYLEHHHWSFSALAGLVLFSKVLPASEKNAWQLNRLMTWRQKCVHSHLRELRGTLKCWNCNPWLATKVFAELRNKKLEAIPQPKPSVGVWEKPLHRRPPKLTRSNRVDW